MPAFYLKKLIRRLPAPLGMAEVVETEYEEIIVNGRKLKKAIRRARRENLVDGNVRVNNEVSQGKILAFIRECDIPLIDGDWVKYRDVLHAVFFRMTRKQAEEDPDSDADDDDDDGGGKWFHLEQFQRPEVAKEHDGLLYQSDISREGVPSGRSEEHIVVQTQRHSADEWFAAVVVQAWFRGRAGRIKFNSEKEIMIRRRSMREDDVFNRVNANVKKEKKKKKKKAKEKEKKIKREGKMGRKHALRDL